MDNVEVMYECALNYPIFDENHFAYITTAEYTIQDGGPMFFLLMPVIDGTFLPDNPITMLKTGNFKVRQREMFFILLKSKNRKQFYLRNVLFFWVPIVTKAHILWSMLMEMRKLQVMPCQMSVMPHF